MTAPTMAATAKEIPFGTAHLTKRQLYDKLNAALKTERDSNWRAHWQDIGDYLLTRRLRWNNVNDRNRGDKRLSKILNNTGGLALRTLRSGMMSGITSPARPWFRLTTPDPGLAEFGPVKDWLHTVTARMREVFLRSNFYKILPTMYGDLGAFATSLGILLDDPRTVMRSYVFPLGSYVLALSDRCVVDTFIREYSMTVRQLVRQFGDASEPNPWARFSQTVRNAWDQGNYHQPVQVVHVVAPNMDYRRGTLAAKYKPIASCYYEADSSDAGRNERFLRESGFDEFPGLGVRWDTESPDDTYGSESPGMLALPDIKGLQVLQKRKAEAIEKQVRPPMKGPARLRSQKVSILPGDMTYDDEQPTGGKLEPIYQVTPDIKGLVLDIQEHERRISRVMYEDLFLMLANSDRRQITAREVAERHEEKLLMLGPVLEHLNDELLKPAIDRTFAIMERRGMIPRAPDELAGMELKVEYISIMHQAQKMVAAASMDAFLTRVGHLAGVKPDVVDKVDFDQVVDEYGEIYGVPPRIVVPDDGVADIRDARARAQQQAQASAQAAELASAGKTLSETDTEGKNALTDLLALAGQGQG